jgi:hypothetical protein
MTSTAPWQPPAPSPSSLRWLLDTDPAIRWQALRDLTDASEEEVAAERAKVGKEGWGAQVLALQGEDGNWSDELGPNWASTLYALLLLKAFGLDPSSDEAQRMIGLVREKVNWGPNWPEWAFFEGEVEPCINGGTLALAGYFGVRSDALLERLLGEQLEDGGWNCEAENGSVRSSFHTTICVLEGLLAYEQAHGADPAVAESRRRAEDYLMDRAMFRRLSTGEVIAQAWTRFAFPTTWHYDVLRGLDYLRAAGVTPDERVDEAVRLVAQRRHQNGRWPLAKPHHDPVGIDLGEVRGRASRWNMLRALRVFDWYEEGRGS